MKRLNRKSIKGFSLIELMISLVVVGILGAIAYPNYVENVRQGNRTEAIAEMQSILGAQERYFLTNREYADALTKLGFASNKLSLDNFDIEASECDAPYNGNLAVCAKLTATAKDGQEKDGNIVMNTIGRSVLITPDSKEIQL